MVEGESYDCDEPALAAMRDAAHALCEEYNRPERTRGERGEILWSLLGPRCRSSEESANEEGAIEGSGVHADGIVIEPPLRVDYGVNIRVGQNFFANFDCTFLDCATITIGNNVFLGPGAQLYTVTHPLDAVERRRTEFAEPTLIGDDVWIGGCVIVLPGVTIGDGVVVAAGVMVTRDVEDDVVVVAGAPARASIGAFYKLM